MFHLRLITKTPVTKLS